MSLGDTVIVYEESLSRSLWKMGCVEALIVGRDGRTRGATVRVIGKNGRVTSKSPIEAPLPTRGSSE